MTARRREVLDAAARLFHERGYRGASMDHLAEAVGLTKGSLYHHFPGKAHILAEIYDEAAGFVLEHTARHDGDAPPSEVVRSLIRDIVLLIGEHRYHVTVFYQEMRWVREWLPAAEAANVEAKIRAYIEYVESALRQGMEAGEFRELDVSVAAYALIGMASWTYQWYRPDGPLSVDQVTDVFAGIYLRGIARDA